MDPFMFGKVLLLVFGLSIASAGRNDPELCLVQPDMKPSYIRTSVYKETNSQGCFSSFSTSKSQEIHYIRIKKVYSRLLSQVGNQVLNILIKQVNPEDSYSHKLILVLDLPQFVDVNIDSLRVKSNTSHLLIITGVSNRAITSSHLNFKLKEKSKSGLLLLNSIKKKYGGVTSFTEIQEVSQLLLKIGKISGAPPVCSFKKVSASPVVKAWSLEQIAINGCFHSDLTGTGSSDVHILEIGSACPPLEAGEENGPVLVHLTSTVPTKRNLTLILKSKENVVWNVDAYNIEGAVRIEADQPVGFPDTMDVSKITVTKKNIPDQFDWLILEATRLHGAPVTYAKLDDVCLVELSVEQRQQDIRKPTKHTKIVLTPANWEEDPELKTGEHYSSLFKPFGLQYPPIQPDARRETWVGQLASEVNIRCIKTTREIEVTIPRSVVEAVGISSHQLTLNDPVCHAYANNTHYLIESAFGSCGAVVENEGENVIYRNQLIMRRGPAIVDDEDWEAGSGHLDYQHSGHPSIAFQCESPRRHNYPTKSEAVAEIPALQHHMELFSDWQMLHHLTNEKREPIVQPVGHVLYVKVSSEYSPGLGLVLERCWLTQSSHLLHSNPRYLLNYGCPANAHVGENVIEETYSTFSFHLEEDMKGKHFLHCQVGVCSTLSKTVSIVQCPQSYECRSETLMKKKFFPGDTTVVSIGPLMVVDKTSPQHPQVPISKQLAMFQSGVSLEVAVGVAFASFALGVILTGTLWFIRYKTDPVNNSCRNRNSNSGSDILRQSYTSSPSSQSSMESRLKEPSE